MIELNVVSLPNDILALCARYIPADICYWTLQAMECPNKTEEDIVEWIDIIIQINHLEAYQRWLALKAAQTNRSKVICFLETRGPLPTKLLKKCTVQSIKHDSLDTFKLFHRKICNLDIEAHDLVNAPQITKYLLSIPKIVARFPYKAFLNEASLKHKVNLLQLVLNAKPNIRLVKHICAFNYLDDQTLEFLLDNNQITYDYMNSEPKGQYVTFKNPRNWRRIIALGYKPKYGKTHISILKYADCETIKHVFRTITFDSHHQEEIHYLINRNDPEIVKWMVEKSAFIYQSIIDRVLLKNNPDSILHLRSLCQFMHLNNIKHIFSILPDEYLVHFLSYPMREFPSYPIIQRGDPTSGEDPMRLASYPPGQSVYRDVIHDHYKDILPILYRRSLPKTEAFVQKILGKGLHLVCEMFKLDSLIF